jgi:hypothetical protein
MSQKSSLNFLMDPATIRANQSGEITAEQRKRATPSRMAAAFVIICCFPFFCIVAVGVLIQWQKGTLSNLLAWPRTLDTLFDFLLYLALAGPIIFLLFYFHWRGRVLRELAAGSIAQIEGQVVYTPVNASYECYQARTPGLALRGTDGKQEVLLPPGVYRFFYLPFSRRILSGEWVGPNEPGGPYAEMLRALMKTNAFTEDDLALNQQGLLSPTQQARWNKYSYDPKYGPREAKVQMQEAFVDRDMDELDGATYYSYVIPKIRFTPSVSAPAYHALIPGVRYRVHFVLLPWMLLSIEPLP